MYSLARQMSNICKRKHKKIRFYLLSNLAFQNIYKVGLISEVTANFEAGSGRGNIY